MKKKSIIWNRIPASQKKKLYTSAILLFMSPLSVVADDTLEMDGFIENATNFREDRGLSKSRNTAQIEFSKALGEFGVFSDASFNTTLRATYDAVYDLNNNEFGKNAGGSILIEDQVVGPLPHGQGLGTSNPSSPYFGAGLPPTHVLGFDATNNPNEGLQVLGQFLHAPGGGVTFGVPVRPCNIDPRGC
ncbi:MAG: hypothetical protein L3J46_11285, partial [Kangiellaceae bacterium]|nr:hypothetical protein [Kangiellaceae bacterium]